MLHVVMIQKSPLYSNDKFTQMMKELLSLRIYPRKTARLPMDQLPLHCSIYNFQKAPEMPRV